MIFAIYGVPVSQCRHRMSRGRAYDPRAAVKKILRVVLAEQMRAERYKMIKDEPIRFTLDVYTPIAKSSSKNRVRELLRMGWDMSKPDVDNFAKFYLDILTGLAYDDDKNIVELHVTKKKSLEPRVEIEVISIKCEAQHEEIE